MFQAVAGPPRSRAAVRQGWQGRLDRFRHCGLCVVAFCRREGISCQALYYWKQKLPCQAVAPAEGARLVPVRRLTPPSPVEVVLPGGAVLRLGPDCDLAFVRSLVDALGRTPC
jgi:hypothetical protein